MHKILSNKRNQVRKNPSFRNDIQHLRALAVILVVAFHYFPNSFENGFLGVDLFFIISGYVITGVIQNRLDKGNFEYLAFLRGRFFRLYPALLFMSLVVLFTFFFLADRQTYLQFFKSGISALTYSSNFYFYNIDNDYWAVGSNFQPFLHTWSLGIEQSFYLIWPIIYVLAFKKKRTQLVSIYLVIFSFTIYLILIRYNEQAAFYFPLSRFWQIGLGSIAFIVYQKNQVKLSKIGKRYLAIILWIALFSIFIIDTSPKLLTQILLCIIIFLLLALDYELPFISTRNSTIGDQSYSIYLWHWPLMSLSWNLFGRTPPIEVKFLLIFVLLLLSNFTYKFIESKYRVKTSFGLKSKLLAGISVGIILVSVIQPSFLSGLKPNLFDDFTATKRAPMTNIKCTELFPVDERPDYCKVRRTGLQGKAIAIVGDSHADVVYEGLVNDISIDNTNLILLANSNCPSIISLQIGNEIESQHCRESSRAILNYLLKNKDFDKILFVFRTSYYVLGKDSPSSSFDSSSQITLNNEKQFPTENERIKKLLGAFEETVSLLQRENRNIYFLEENPSFDVLPLNCQLPLLNRFLDCSPVSVVNVKSFQRNLSEKLAISSNSTLIPALDVLCSQICEIAPRNQLLYADNDHLSLAGVRRLVPRIIEFMGLPTSKYQRERFLQSSHGALFSAGSIFSKESKRSSI
jgi:peptidoglycan/LPS O-acetylase OafA/YrhL